MDLCFEPTKFWGLHYAHRTHFKLYIADVLHMKPYAMFPGAYQYGNHPVYRVDIAGVVVLVDENSSFHLYAIDDGTGVIKICQLKDKDNPDTQTDTQTDKYSLGDYLHIRGKMQTFRDANEVFAYDCFRIDDPMFEVLRMGELPALYTHKYNLPFQVPFKVQQEIKMHKSGKAWLCRLLNTDSVTHIMEKCGRFRIADLIADGTLTELIPTASVADIQEALTFILSSLETDGSVYRLCYDDFTYQLNGGLHCQLRDTVVKLLGKARPSDKGCHYSRLWEKLSSFAQFRRLKLSAVRQCLESLECDSRVVSLVTHHYALVTDT